MILVCVCGRFTKLAGKKQHIDPMWTVLMKQVDLGDQQNSSTTSIWVVLNGNAKQAKILSTISTICSNQECQQEQQKKYLARRESDANISASSYDMECFAKKCVERYCELAN